MVKWCTIFTDTMNTLLQGLLYAGAPFYTYPFKPVVNQFVGSGYPTAYTHFRRDHSTPTNLLLHCGCFIAQLVGNFSLLKLVAESVPLCSSLPEVSAVLWAGSLFAAEGCPPDVKLAALGALSAGYRWGGAATNHWHHLASLHILFETIAIGNLVGKKRGGKLGVAAGVAFVGARLGLHSVVFGNLFGSLDTPIGLAVVYGITLAYLGMTSIKENPIPTPGTTEALPIYVFTYGLFAWALAGLANQPSLFFLGMGFMANVMQVRCAGVVRLCGVPCVRVVVRPQAPPVSPTWGWMRPQLRYACVRLGTSEQ
jgi:hypothetical protein